MGNRAKRKAIAKLLKEQKLGKLYHGRRFVALRMLDRYWLRQLLYKLQFKVGDIVNDCDAMNHIIKRAITSYRSSEQWLDHGRGARMLDLDQFEFEDGRWSCGCPTSPERPYSKEKIEQIIRDTLAAVKPEHLEDTLKHSPVYRAFHEGREICDEKGMLLPGLSLHENPVP